MVNIKTYRVKNKYKDKLLLEFEYFIDESLTYGDEPDLIISVEKHLNFVEDEWVYVLDDRIGHVNEEKLINLTDEILNAKISPLNFRTKEEIRELENQRIEYFLKPELLNDDVPFVVYNIFGGKNDSIR